MLHYCVLVEITHQFRKVKRLSWIFRTGEKLSLRCTSATRADVFDKFLASKNVGILMASSKLLKQACLKGCRLHICCLLHGTLMQLLVNLLTANSEMN